MPRDEVRSLAHVYGHHKRHAAYRFSALLPIVVRDRIFMDDGCTHHYEWAAKFGAMTEAEVDRILALWGAIGQYDCLWRLLAEGVGMTKLERIAPHVTEENAEWLATQARNLTKPEIVELLRTMRRGEEDRRMALQDAETRGARGTGQAAGRVERQGVPASPTGGMAPELEGGMPDRAGEEPVLTAADRQYMAVKNLA